MDKHIRKLIVTEFERLLQIQMPEYIRDTSAEMPRGWYLYSKRLPKVSLFLVLVTSPRDNRFTLEIAWSTTHQFPHCTSFGPNEPPGPQGLQFRLSALWSGTGADYWWRVSEPSVGIVQAQVGTAVVQLTKYGVPYLEELARLQ